MQLIPDLMPLNIFWVNPLTKNPKFLSFSYCVSLVYTWMHHLPLPSNYCSWMNSFFLATTGLFLLFKNFQMQLLYIALSTSNRWVKGKYKSLMAKRWMGKNNDGFSSLCGMWVVHCTAPLKLILVYNRQASFLIRHESPLWRSGIKIIGKMTLWSTWWHPTSFLQVWSTYKNDY